MIYTWECDTALDDTAYARITLNSTRAHPNTMKVRML